MRVISCNLITVTSVTWLRLRLRRHMVREFHIYTIAWLRGYVVTRLRGYTNFFKPNLNIFSTVTVTVTSVTWLRLRLRRHMVRDLHNYKVAWLRGYTNFFKKKCQLFFQP